MREINRVSMSERMSKDHPGNLHLWWNRSPISSSAELLKAALTDEGADSWEKDLELNIVDPFSGSGCLSLAALESGLPVFAGDLNSVAAVVTKAVAEFPARFGNSTPVSPEAEIRMYRGTECLAEDVRRYGTWMKRELATRLASVYPDAIAPDENGRQVYAWIWTRTAQCPNPACRCTMPLAGSYVLSRTKGQEYHVQPVLDEEQLSFDMCFGAPETALTGNKIGKQGARFRCPRCGTITKDEYVKSVGLSGRLGLQMMAVCRTSGGRKSYCSPDQRQLDGIFSDIPEDCPVGELPDNTRWFSPPLFGLKEYASLYTPRQLLLLTSLCDLVKEAQERCREDAVKAGFAEDGVPLGKGGSGALAYSQAVSVYLSLLVGKLSNFQSTVCTWDNRNGNVRSAFTRQAIPMTWVFAEGNPFSTVTGNYNTLLANLTAAIEKLPANDSAQVLQCDALKFPFPENSMLFTELPYCDNVGYADLSDYFYIWLRRCLKDIFPEMFERVVSSKEELTSIPEHYDSDPKKAAAAYEAGLRELFRTFSEHASADAPSIVFFEFGGKDEQAMESGDGTELSSWENILDAILRAGFQITATLPIRTELPNERYQTSRVAIVFRKLMGDAEQTVRRTAVGELKRELPWILETRFQADVDERDKPIVGMGCGLALMTRYSRILNADGSMMTIHDALQVIWAEVKEYIRTAEAVDDSFNS